MKNLTSQQMIFLSVILLAIIASLTALVITGHTPASTLQMVLMSVVAWLLPSPAIAPAVTSPAQPTAIQEAPTQPATSAPVVK